LSETSNAADASKLTPSTGLESYASKLASPEFSGSRTKFQTYN